MNIKDVYILDEAAADLEDGKLFYDHQQAGIGNYFWDSIISDIESLVLYAGIHKKVYDLFQMYSKRFPYAIYYDMNDQSVYVIAILPMRRDPALISQILGDRNS